MDLWVQNCCKYFLPLTENPFFWKSGSAARNWNFCAYCWSCGVFSSICHAGHPWHHSSPVIDTGGCFFGVGSGGQTPRDVMRCEVLPSAPLIRRQRDEFYSSWSCLTTADNLNKRLISSCSSDRPFHLVGFSLAIVCKFFHTIFSIPPPHSPITSLVIFRKGKTLFSDSLKICHLLWRIFTSIIQVFVFCPLCQHDYYHWPLVCGNPYQMPLSVRCIVFFIVCILLRRWKFWNEMKWNEMKWNEMKFSFKNPHQVSKMNFLFRDFRIGTGQRYSHQTLERM